MITPVISDKARQHISAKGGVVIVDYISGNT